MSMLTVISACLEDQSVYVENLDETFSEETQMSDLQLDDDGYSDLVFSLENRYDITLDEDAVKQAETVEDLMKIIREEL